MDKVDLNSGCENENRSDNSEIIIDKTNLNDEKCLINSSGDINELNSVKKEDDLADKGTVNCGIDKTDSKLNQKNIDESIKNPLLSKEISADCQNVEITSELKKVSVEIRDVGSINKLPNESRTKSNAFTERQECDSSTEDSESDSSSSSESESESSSSSSSKESTSSDDEAPVKKKTSPRGEDEERAALNESIKKKRASTKYKNELDMEDLPPIEDLHITVLEDECEPLGTICSIVNQLVVVGSLPNKPALNLDSILFNKDGTCLGQIFDVFGPVKTPFYTIRFNSKADIETKGIQVGQMVYCAPQTSHTKYVFVYQLMKQKGSDASWKHNYEVPESQMDYSDDEEERMAKRRHQQRTRGRPKSQTEETNFPKKKQQTSGFVNNYSQYCNNEWYRARVSEMNQFNNINRSGQMNRSHQSGFDSGGEMSGSPSSYLSPRPLIRPPTSNLWNKPPQSGPTNYVNNQEYPSQNNQQPYFSNNNLRGLTRPFIPMNPPTLDGWSQSQPNHQGPFRINNTRQSGLMPPRPLTFAPPPPLPRPNVPFNNYPWSSQPSRNNN